MGWRRPRCARCRGWLWVEDLRTPDGCVELSCINCGARVYLDIRADRRSSDGERQALARWLGYVTRREVSDVQEWAERQPAPLERDAKAWRNRGSKYG